MFGDTASIISVILYNFKQAKVLMNADTKRPLFSYDGIKCLSAAKPQRSL
jgi:hypothetical protein